VSGVFNRTAPHSGDDNSCYRRVSGASNRQRRLAAIIISSNFHAKLKSRGFSRFLKRITGVYGGINLLTRNKKPGNFFAVMGKIYPLADMGFIKNKVDILLAVYKNF
jgi:hypothetical protein